MSFFSNTKQLEKLQIKGISSGPDITIKNERNIILLPADTTKPYIIKCARVSSHFPSSLTNESWFYNWIYSNQTLLPMRKFISIFYGSFQQGQILAIENLSNFITLYSYYKRRKTFSKIWTVYLAENLAKLHSISFIEINNKSSEIPRHKLEVPLVNKITPEFLAHNENSLIELIEILQNQDEFASLHKFQASQNPRCLIHGDIKFDNILIKKFKDNPSRKMIFIDWELCGLGDPEYDVATIIANFLLFWINSVKLQNSKELIDWQSHAMVSFTHLKEIISTFWSSYFYRQNRCTSDLIVDKMRSIEYVGVVLIQYVYSKILAGCRLSSNDVLCLIMTKSFLAKPSIISNILKLE